MKLIVGLVSIVCLVLISCHENIELHNVWAKKASFDTLRRVYSVGLTMNGKGYVGLGYTNATQTDWWQYTPQTSTWTRKSDYPGLPRIRVFHTTDDRMAYVGMGGDGSYPRRELLRDIWQYDPENDKWSFLTVGPTTEGYKVLASFILDRKLYVSNGNGLWAFDLATKIWQPKNDLPFDVWSIDINYENGRGLVISNEAYFFFIDRDKTNPLDLAQSFSAWKYDPTLDKWTVVVDRCFTYSIDWESLYVLDNYVYYCTRDNHRHERVNIWEEKPSTDYLDFQQDFNVRSIVAFTIGDRAHMFLSNGEYWQYIP